MLDPQLLQRIVAVYADVGNGYFVVVVVHRRSKPINNQINQVMNYEYKEESYMNEVFVSPEILPGAELFGALAMKVPVAGDGLPMIGTLGLVSALNPKPPGELEEAEELTLADEGFLVKRLFLVNDLPGGGEDTGVDVDKLFMFSAPP